jgi:hypothetical protein
MLTIKNIEKIKGKQITDYYEVYDTDVSRDGTTYVFTISNVGYYKHITWYFSMDRNEYDGIKGAHKLWTNNNGQLYVYALSKNDITPVGIIAGMYNIMDEIKKYESK